MYNAVFEFEKSQITMIDGKNPGEIFGETRQDTKLRFLVGHRTFPQRACANECVMFLKEHVALTPL